VDRELSDELNGLMPVVAHRLGGVDCDGSIIAVVESGSVELRCNECGAVVGVVQVGIMEGLLGLDCADATCLHCGELSTSSGFDELLLLFVCQHCGMPVESAGSE
jgi:hypothetical protein